VTFLRWIAGFVLFLQLPVPLFWFVVHPSIRFWRRHQTAAYVTGVLVSWPAITLCLIVFRHQLFLRDAAPAWRIAIGIALIVFEVWIFWRVKHDLGTAKLAGKTELSGGGEVVSRGIYGRLRHPRYVGSFIAILGACFLAGARLLWIVTGVWAVLTLIAIAMEEREMRTRFGESYVRYGSRVPRFIPFTKNRDKSGTE
jgi:protein-S-isoprenylcysteine O-methyltransferase Ste14